MRRMVLLLLAALTACTAVDKATLPVAHKPSDIFITQAAAVGPYESAGPVQLTRRGVVLFGFIDVVGSDLQAAVNELSPFVRRAGADGVVNARFTQTQYTTVARILGLIFFFVPLPSEVTVTGELVRLRPSTPPPPTGAPSL